ncbi:MAG: type I methionyl aminopeptidase [Clostridia bacterium]|nr:type I methionyl aminopeptidase [Clostridia bacterium]
MINIKSRSQIDKMQKSADILIRVFDELEKVIEPGITTKYLDSIAAEVIRKHDALPSFKGQPGMFRDSIPFPAVLCISVNDEVIHGLPSDRVLLEGDIVSIDGGVLLDGFHSDAARTYAVGNISPEAQRLIDVTRDSFFAGAAAAVYGNRISHISAAIQQVVESNGYSVVRDFIGHGVGRELHEEPEVPNFVSKFKGPRLEPGMAIAVEPMVNMGTYEVTVDMDNKWTVYTKDHSLSAHYENTIVITEDEPMILTLKR